MPSSGGRARRRPTASLGARRAAAAARRPHRAVQARQRLGLWEKNRIEEFGETAVGNGVIMGVGMYMGTYETTTAGFKVNLSWGRAGGYVFTSS